ncbi:hypothetical protein [Candidatus Chloroploca sp. Khr17]|uniref:hypothetical protein n=1 Tax=Candidatus Chloroploca sp. Khr17 TaxID=2496869 RepID=UPI00101B9006|nr:hypothetical protein [Candidatus Chloroploca sp. Khr17]
MPDQLPIAVAPRFTRAIHIRRDFRDLRYRLDGYQVTPLVYQTAGRIVAGLAPEATERAFSIIGPFGSGKSAFGLFVAHFLQRKSAARRQLLGSLKVDDAAALLPLDAPALLAVLVPGNNRSLRAAVLEALGDAIEGAHLRSPALDVLRQQVSTLASDPALDPGRVAALVVEAARTLRAHGPYQGLLLLVDELGQFLDYAAREEEERDLFVLQSLAEAATRSGDAPVLVVTILHQAFERYTFNAGSTRRIEWAKVQGRFVDLTFQEPASQMIRMVAAALRPDARDPLREARAAWAARLAPAADALGLRPAEIGVEEWARIVADSYPLHPTVLVALPNLFRQLAQNERSLFAFLHSDEPWALRDVAHSPATAGALPAYRLTHLYAYVEASLGPGLFVRARGQRWSELAEARAALLDSDPLLLDVITTVGTIGALERSSGLRASQAQVAFALANEPDDPAVADALLALLGRRMLAYRQHRDSYIIWEGSDLDLDALTQEARRELGERASLPALLQRYADATPRIARRHSYRTGAARLFAVRYVDLGQLSSELPSVAGFDGELLYVVPADEEELAQALHWAQDPQRRAEPGRITVVPRRVRELRELLLDAAALRVLLDERPELETDRAARREVAGRLLEAQEALAQVIADTYGSERSRWFHQADEQKVTNSRHIDDVLSDAASATYPLAPQVWNELIVRRQLSSAAAKGRRNLVEAMLERANEEQLGLIGYPPERAIYESILKQGGLHHQDETGVWRIGPPPSDNPLKLRPTWDALDQLLQEESEDPHPLTKVFATLENPPYGVKAGLIPLLFVALYMSRAGEINLYERGNYVPLPDMSVFERLLTRPEYFAVRLSRADGVRRQVYERLAKGLAPRALAQPVQPALLAVAMPLFRLLNGLPFYTKQTRQLSTKAQAIRQALREARSPDELLFDRLPRACRLQPFRADEPEAIERVEVFIAALREGRQELLDAYPQLLARLTTQICTAFGVQSIGAKARSELQERHRAIVDSTNDAQIRALGVRLETADDGDVAWIESVAALIAKRSPEQWHDGDIPAFEVALADLVRRFRTAEDLAVAARIVPAEAPILRIALTNGQGELSRVIHADAHDPAVERLRTELMESLGRHNQLSTDQRAAALASLLKALFDQANQKDEILR